MDLDFGVIMGFYIKIEKTFEEDTLVHYSFEGDYGRRGVLGFNKVTGEATLVKSMPEDECLNYFNRAVVKVTREWREGRLPRNLEWAS